MGRPSTQCPGTHFTKGLWVHNENIVNILFAMVFNSNYPIRSHIYTYHDRSWWRHQMETFSALLAICAGNSPVSGEFPAQRPVMRSFDIFFDLRLNKRLSKQSWGWWFEMLSCPLWRHCNVYCRGKLRSDLFMNFFIQNDKYFHRQNLDYEFLVKWASGVEVI